MTNPTTLVNDIHAHIDDLLAKYDTLVNDLPKEFISIKLKQLQYLSYKLRLLEYTQSSTYLPKHPSSPGECFTYKSVSYPNIPMIFSVRAVSRKYFPKPGLTPLFRKALARKRALYVQSIIGDLPLSSLQALDILQDISSNDYHAVYFMHFPVNCTLQDLQYIANTTKVDIFIPTLKETNVRFKN